MQRNRTDVVEAALGILDEYGLADLTMRRLASTLGLQPGALYWHFPNKQAVLGAVSDAIVAPVITLASTPPAPDHQWADAVSLTARAVRSALLSRKDAAETVAASLSARTMETSLHAALEAPIRAGGLSERHASIAADALLFYILGSAADEQARLQLDSAGASAHTAEPIADTANPTERFEFGLRLFIDGIAVRANAVEVAD